MKNFGSTEIKENQSDYYNTNLMSLRVKYNFSLLASYIC